MYTVTVSEKGQVVIPGAIRRRFGIKKGDKLVVEEVNDTLILRPLPPHPLLSLRGRYGRNEGLTTLLLQDRRLEREQEDR